MPAPDENGPGSERRSTNRYIALGAGAGMIFGAALGAIGTGMVLGAAAGLLKSRASGSGERPSGD